MSGNLAATRYSVSLHLTLLVCFCLAAVVTVPGCSGCQSTTKTAAQKKKEADEAKKKLKDKKKEKPKKPFEYERMHTQPGDTTLQRNTVKSGHYVTCTQMIKANNYDFQAELMTASVDRNQQPLTIENTPFNMVMTRPAALPKGQAKHFETVFFIPRDTSKKSQLIWLQSKMRARRGGREITGTMELTTQMPSYQYFFIVLSDTPDAYGFLKKMDTVIPPSDEFDERPDIMYYRVILPNIDRRVPMPSNPLTWTSVAYILWDDLNPNLLSPDQQDALLDWIHWGGHLVISGPDSLDTLKGSWLADYLPAEPVQATELGMDSFAPINDYWSLKMTKDNKEEFLSLEILEDKPIVGVELKLKEGARFQRETGDLVAERRVGKGRIVTTAFPLSNKTIVNWKSFDCFVHNCLLRRPPRHFVAQQFGSARATWMPPYSGAETDACLASNLRYLTRDVAPLVPTSNRGANASNFGRLNVDDWRYNGYWQTAKSGVSGWNDESGTAEAARASLKDAAGISIPKAGFVFRVLAVYLIVLVPVNWAFFRAIRRVEWAWVAAPVIAMVGAVAVVKLVQLDIGFARSRTEIAVLEAHGDYSRGHLTRYTALYSSLSTGYDMTFEDDSALAQPFPAMRQDYDDIRTVSFHRDREVRLSGYQVDSNTTGMIHSEQMFDMGGAFQLVGDEANGFELKNDSKLSLQGAGVIRRTNNGFDLAWLGEVKPKTSLMLSFTPSNAPRFTQWNESNITFSHELELNAVMSKFDANGDGVLSADELDPDHDIMLEYDSWDNDGNLTLTREEVMGWLTASRAGEISLGRLIDLVEKRMRMSAGEVRLVGWTKEEMPGFTIKPRASQSDLNMLAVVHLRRPQLPEVRRDQNARLEVADDLEDIVEGGSIGVAVLDLTRSQVVNLRLPNGRGVMISSVEEGGPAHQKGLRAGEIILKIDNTEVVNARMFNKSIRDLPPGTKIKLTLYRNGIEVEVEIVVGDSADSMEFFPR